MAGPFSRMNADTDGTGEIEICPPVAPTVPRIRGTTSAGVPSQKVQQVPPFTEEAATMPRRWRNDASDQAGTSLASQAEARCS
jgi:hypothetical protein